MLSPLPLNGSPLLSLLFSAAELLPLAVRELGRAKRALDEEDGELSPIGGRHERCSTCELRGGGSE